MTVKLILWKPDNPVSITSDSWNDFGLFVIIKSMQVGFMGFLTEVLSLTIFLQPQIWQKFLIVASFSSILKLPIRKKIHIAQAANLNFCQCSLVDELLSFS